MSILTPQTDPDHYAVGRRFRAFGVDYICDSYDPAIGFWMTPADPNQPYPFNPLRKDERRNVSERAIGRTYHRVWED